MDLRLLFVVLYALAAVLPFTGVVIAIRQARARYRDRVKRPVTYDDLQTMISTKPLEAELRDLWLSGWLVDGGLVFGAVASIWSMYAL